MLCCYEIDESICNEDIRNKQIKYTLKHAY
jgi:hypothetical protein